MRSLLRLELWSWIVVAAYSQDLFVDDSLQSLSATRLDMSTHRDDTSLLQKNMHRDPTAWPHFSSRGTHAKHKHQQSPTPGGISQLDLWAIHDLLLLGHSAPLIQESDTAGLKIVQDSAISLGDMLGTIHPVAACRESIGQEQTLPGKALASWACLGLGAKNFSGPYTASKKAFQDTANTEPKFDKALGACAGSKWPRACSYWASMHAIGVLADVEQKAPEFFQAVLHLMSGGALDCFGCTSHFRFLNEKLLAPELRDHNDLTPL